MALQRCTAWPQAHSRGENNEGGPPARGSLPGGLATTLIPSLSLFREGLIPAHAGKTRRATKRAVRSRAHPRSRGENLVEKPNVVAGLGSSPLTRGKHDATLTPHEKSGLIPAHAGKTREGRKASDCARAHPRSRGENRRRLSLHLLPAGLIPAHAGKTLLGGRARAPSQAHPRSRGENCRA